MERTNVDADAKLVKVGIAHYIDINKAEKIELVRLKRGDAGYNKDGVTYCAKVIFNGKEQIYYGKAAFNISFHKLKPNQQ